MRKNQKADGTFPLVIRITKDKKTSYIGLEHSIHEKDWDAKTQRVKRSHLNATRLNNFIIKRLSEATNSALELETNKAHVSSAALRQKIKPKAGSTLFAQADLYLSQLLSDGKKNRYSADKSRVKHLKDYFKNDIAFQDISINTLERYKAHLKTFYKMNERSALNHIVVVRSVFSQAIKDGVCDEKYNPFGKNKFLIKFPDTKKTGLSADDIAKLETVELNDRQSAARDIFLFSYYTAGMRISDIFRLNWNDIHDGRLNYIMGKNNKTGSLKLPEKAMQIIDGFRENNPAHNLVFPDLKSMHSLDNPTEVQTRIKTRVRNVDTLLKLVAKEAGITKTLTMHIARHTFAQLASDKIPIQVLQKLYRHSSLITTAGYQSNFSNKDTDDALDAVLNPTSPNSAPPASSPPTPPSKP